MLDLVKLLKIPGIDPDNNFDVSPDGKTVVFSWNISGQWELYTLSLEDLSSPKCITHGAGAKFSPCWSPDGSNLAYVLDIDGGENYDIFVCNLPTGKHTNLTPNTEYAIQPHLSWSPDGSQLVFAADVSGKFNIYRLTLSDGVVFPLSDLPYPVDKAIWSPDGNTIAALTYASGQDFFTYLVSVENGAFSPIAINKEPICALDIAWSPTGDRLAFASDVSNNFQIGIFHNSTGDITWITDNDKENDHPAWSLDDRQMVYISQDGPDTELIIQQLDHQKAKKSYKIDQGIHYFPAFISGGKEIVLGFDNPSHPTDLWRLSLESGTFRQLTNSLPSEFENTTFSTPRHVHYTSQDGKRVPALLYQPDKGTQPCPAVVYIHGGPNWLAQFTWDPLIQHMVSRGWVVLAPNYRGSIGYGKPWQTANRFDLGGRDTGDIAAAVDYLMSNHIAQADRIAVTGRSYGGYLTMTSLTHYPGLWVGGSAVVPFMNWFTGHENSRQDLQHWDLENFGDPVKDKALYYERSPFFFLDRVKSPVQFICGAHDPRCPASESIQAHDALLAMGKPCDLVLYPDEGHVFLKIDNVVDAKRRQVDFLAGLLDNRGKSQ
ncbi:MAG: S9 family peptidase [Anaerolineales bacterium]|nr:S9 family peptidase [Anaerolineales bacterium]